MWLIILFSLVTAYIVGCMAIDAIYEAKYPVADQYWMSGTILVLFLAGLLAMTFV